MINLEDFQKLDLRVARIIEARPVEGSNKLLKLDLDLGGEKRQIVSGIARSYDPEDLVGKEIVVIANLEPRQILGLESQGMLLATGEKDNGIIFLVPEKEVEPGSKIR